MVCAHTEEEAGHRGICTTMHRLGAYCVWEVAARTILEWVSGLGIPVVFVSDGAPHFKNETLKLVAAKLEASHRFSVAHSPWSNGTVKRMNLEVVRTFRAAMSERGRPLLG